MNLKRCLSLANESSLPGWQTGQAVPSLRPTSEKLEKPCRSYRRNRRAAAAVEFALVAPVFFLLILGMVEYGRMVMVQQVITNASREGARRAVLDGATTSEVQTLAKDYMTSAGVSPTGATVTVAPNPPNNAAFGEAVTVTVAIPFSQVSWLPSPMYLGGRTLTASTVMRREDTVP
ncbi:MAG TPA: TadE/TadG family type IV pilus assembly protein [Pirellulaceae bacterium]|nr:TadE/TadG family type IV pilus assembly protein [Pirellulaceae bacterium]